LYNNSHEGPVWQVTWAHPQFGNIIASCSYDHKVIIWKETNQWSKIHEYSHQGSVNSIAWAPHECGLSLAAGSSDGSITVITFDETEGTWKPSHIPKAKAHDIGCNCVSWGPAAPISALLADAASGSAAVASGAAPVSGAGATLKHLVSGGGDNKVKIWRYGEDGEWNNVETLEGHGDWIRDVAWAPNIGLPYDTLASCSQDKNVIIWTRTAGTQFTKAATLKFNAVVWRVSWSVTGNILAVSTANNEVSLYKDVEGKWTKLSSLSNDSSKAAPQQQGAPQTR